MLRVVIVAFMALTVGAGCLPDPKVIAERTSKDVKSFIREAWVAAEGTNQWGTVDQGLGSMGVTPETRATSARVPAVSEADRGFDSLNRRIGAVFAESNIVDRGGGALTFRVRGADLCTNDNGSIDAYCEKDIDRLQLLLRASGDLDLTLLVGPKKAEAFTIEIRKNVSLALIADLEKSIAAIKAIQEAQGASSMPPYSGSGRVEWRLTKNGPEDFTLSTAVLSNARFEVTPGDGQTRVVEVAQSNPASFLRIEGAKRRASLRLASSGIHYLGLVRDLFGVDPASARPLEVSFAGHDIVVVVEDGQTPKLERFSLGNATSSITSQGATLLSVDFNREHGGAVAATFEPQTNGLTARFAPGLQLEVQVGLGVLEDARFRVQPEFRNARYTGTFLGSGGESPAVFFFKNGGSSTGSATIPVARLQHGELRLAVNDSSVAPRAFAAPACLGPSSGSVTNALVEVFKEVPCP